MNNTRNCPTYKVWINMKNRCLNPNNPSYANYGGRGISICERWLNSFTNFKLDMGEKPPGLTLERKNNSGSYEPGNCYWATREAQSRNRRNNINLTFKGKTQCAAEWERELGLSPRTINHRIKHRISGDDLFIPSHQGK